MQDAQGSRRAAALPGRALQQHGGELADLVGAEDRLAPATRRKLIRTRGGGCRTADLLDLQAAYVGLFDRSRSLSLHLFEHVHGESRDRGQAMVDLAACTGKGFWIIAANELPDYLPLFLEFCSRFRRRRRGTGCRK
jgi:nitrate reductase molybdenum cofactor assembly chaperone NarJ/NarW